MKKRSRLGLACKIVAVVRFGFGILNCVPMLMIGFDYDATCTQILALLGAGLLRLIVNDLVLCLILWGVGTLLDQRQQDRQLLERLAQPAQEPEPETLEGVISVDDLESLDGPARER